MKKIELYSIIGALMIIVVCLCILFFQVVYWKSLAEFRGLQLLNLKARIEKLEAGPCGRGEQLSLP